jgi:hypothetical protein
MFYAVFTQQDDVPIPFNYKSKEMWRELFERSGFERITESATETENPFSPVFFVLRKK